MIDIEATLQNEGEQDCHMYMKMVDEDNIQLTIEEISGELLQITVKAQELKIALESVYWNL